MSLRATRRTPGKSHPVILRARLAALSDPPPVPKLLTPPAPPPPNCSEAHFQALIVDLAERFGWICWHDNDPRRNDAGWPDLVLVRGPVALFTEIKTEKGRVRTEQAAWGQMLLAAGLDWRLWRPAQWSEIVDTLTQED